MNRDSERAAVREAAHTLAQSHASPVDALIDNCVEQLAQEYTGLVGGNLENVELIKAGVRRGLELGSTRVGDLL